MFPGPGLLIYEHFSGLDRRCFSGDSSGTAARPPTCPTVHALLLQPPVRTIAAEYLHSVPLGRVHAPSMQRAMRPPHQPPPGPPNPLQQQVAAAAAAGPPLPLLVLVLLCPLLLL